MTKTIATRIRFIECLQDVIHDQEVYGRLHADLHDLVEASEWLIHEISKLEDRHLDLEGLEDFLINLDVNYVQHVSFHLKSLRKDLQVALKDIGKEVE